jgi:hypothetical protein
MARQEGHWHPGGDTRAMTRSWPVNRGWRSLRAGGLGLLVGPRFARRLALTQAVDDFADAFINLSLVGSLFFFVSLDASRSRILLYLLLTAAPLAIAAPLVGPALDRSQVAYRAAIVGSQLVRGLAALALMGALFSLALYPLAFVVLMCRRIYGLAKTARRWLGCGTGGPGVRRLPLVGRSAMRRSSPAHRAVSRSTPPASCLSDRFGCRTSCTKSLGGEGRARSELGHAKLAQWWVLTGLVELPNGTGDRSSSRSHAPPAARPSISSQASTRCVVLSRRGRSRMVHSTTHRPDVPGRGLASVSPASPMSTSSSSTRAAPAQARERDVDLVLRSPVAIRSRQ